MTYLEFITCLLSTFINQPDKMKLDTSITLLVTMVTGDILCLLHWLQVKGNAYCYTTGNIPIIAAKLNCEYIDMRALNIF